MDTMCAFEPCPQGARVLGWCRTHYLQHHRGRTMRMTKKQHPVAFRNESGLKWCHSCEEWVAPTGFAKSSGSGDGLQSRCRPCNALIYRARADIIRDNMRQQRFGITGAEFDALFDSQDRLCAICGTDDPGQNYWSIDHDHGCCPSSDKTCGQCIRGILCGRCNIGIGHLRDNPDILRNAATYLESRGPSVRAL